MGRIERPFPKSPVQAQSPPVHRMFSATLAALFLGGLGLKAENSRLDWPEFRGPTGQGHAIGEKIPVQWSATNNVAWQSAIPGKGWSSPVLASGQVFLTSAVEEGSAISLRVIAVEASSGKLAWNVEALRGESGAAKQIHNKNSLASPTPLIEGGRIYAHFGHMGTAALDLQGEVIWRQTGLSYRPVHGNGGSPALAGDLLIFNCDGAEDPVLAALDKKTGAIRWKTARQSKARNKFSFSTPLLIEEDGRTVLISPASGFVGGYAPETGKELWRVDYGDGYSVVPRPVFGNGLLFIGSGFDRPVLYAIDPKGASGDVTESHVKWTQPKGAPNTPSVLLAGQELYVVSDAGIASCLEAATGKQIWSERLGGNFSASPVLAENRIYAVNEAGTTFVFEIGRTFKLLAKNELNERSLASPALIDGAIFIRTESQLWRIGQ